MALKTPKSLAPLLSRCQTAITATATEYRRRSAREQALIVISGVIAAFFVGVAVFDSITEAFASQTITLDKVASDARATGRELERYLRLRAKREGIEAEYQGVEIEEGVLSLLENLIRTKANVPMGFTIKDGQARALGRQYEQIPYSVKFSTSSLSSLVDFLQEIVRGSRPLLLTRVDIQRSRRGDQLDVDLDVSNIRKAAAPAPAASPRP